MNIILMGTNDRELLFNWDNVSVARYHEDIVMNKEGDEEVFRKFTELKMSSGDSYMVKHTPTEILTLINENERN